MESMPIRKYDAHIQARLVVFRLDNAIKALVGHDKPGEAELKWLVGTADSVLTLARAHAAECERNWRPATEKLWSANPQMECAHLTIVWRTGLNADGSTSGAWLCNGCGLPFSPLAYPAERPTG